MPRSGTTLMNTLLSAHPNITIPFAETKFIREWMKINNASQYYDSPNNVPLKRSLAGVLNPIS